MASVTGKCSIDLGVKFGFLKVIDVDRIWKATSEEWTNQTLCEVNDCVVRLGVVQGGHWHKHDNEDEFFYVVDGKLIVDLGGSQHRTHAQAGVR